MDKDKDYQLGLFKTFLRNAKLTVDSPEYEKARNFLDNFPYDTTPEERRELRRLMASAFQIPETPPIAHGKPFDPLIPAKGWFRDYYEYTLRSEPPSVFHFMSAFTVLGAVLERNVFFDKAFYRVYPNIATILIAPTGRCRKTSATNIALKLAREVEVNVMSERVTPEALVEGLSGREHATGLVYAPELAVFLGRQKYLEGMVPLLTSLFDAPDVWRSRTIGRGEASLAEVALSLLGASTLEWFVEALPTAAFSGGFMARLLFVVQEDTDREFAIPERAPGHLWEGLRENLADIKNNVRGEVTLEPEALDWYKTWYSKHHKGRVADEKFAGYHERKPDHLLRMAYLLRVASNMSLRVTLQDFVDSLRILDWLEEKLPRVFEGVSASTVGAAHSRIVEILRKSGGRLPHSILLRKMQHIMNARSFRDAVETLKESETIIEVHKGLEHHYELLENKE